MKQTTRFVYAIKINQGSLILNLFETKNIGKITKT